MRRDLRQSNLAEVMRHLYGERASGILYVSRQNIRKRIHFNKGVAIFADAGDGQVQTRAQAELLAYSLFTWTSGEFAFEEGEPNIDDSLAFEGSPSTVILEGNRRIDELEILERLIGGRETVFACTQTSVLPLFKLKLSPAESAILRFARERVRFAAADLPLPSGDVAIVSALNALVAVGLLEIVNKANAPESVPVPAPTAPAPAEDAAFDIPAAQAILDSVRRIADVAVLRIFVGSLRATLRLTEDSALPLSRIEMTPAERGLLEAARVRPAFNTEQLLAGSPLSELETLRAVCALISVGLLEAEGTSSAPALDTLEQSEATAEPPPKPETRVAAARAGESIPRRLGRFEIHRLLGRGSMGEVFRGLDPDSDRIVAIKLLHAAAALAPDALEKYLERFHQRVQMARQLYHPSIATVWETGLTEEQCPFLVSEYVQGTSLRDLLPAGPLAVKHAMELATQILDALAYAHSRGIVHGHVKPSNVLVTPGRAKIKDFGLPGLGGPELSASLPYLSPEEFAKGAIDARTDVFSLGVVCYRMLTGAFPFPEGSFTTVMGASRPVEQPAPLERFSPEFPPLLGKTVLRCLAIDPQERFANAVELQEAFSSLAAPAPAVAQVAEIPVVEATLGVEPSGLPPPPEAPTPSPVAPTRQVASAPATNPLSARGFELEGSFRLLEQGRGRGAPAPVADEEPGEAESPSKPAPRLESSGDSGESGSEKAQPAAPPRRTRRWSWVVAAVAGVGAALILFAREEPPWLELPSPPASDVSVTPVPSSAPSEAVLAALLAGPSDEALFAEASSALERGYLRASRSVLMQLLERDPNFPEAQALLARLERVEAERRKAAERRRRAAEKKPEPLPTQPSEAELFSEAESALTRGELAVSKSNLEALLEINPFFSGASELMDIVEHRIWTTTLPKLFSARHNHRVGSCQGNLLLTPTGLSFRSDDHEWAWVYDELISMDRPDAINFNIVTGDRDLLGILAKKRFKFQLRETFSEEDWRFFRETVQGRDPTPAPQN